MLLDARLPHESYLASSRPLVSKTERNGKRRYRSEGSLGRAITHSTQNLPRIFFTPPPLWSGLVEHFVFQTERLKQDGDSRPLHNSDLYLLWHYYNLCCLQQIPRSTWTRKVTGSSGAKPPDTRKGDHSISKIGCKLNLLWNTLKHFQSVSSRKHLFDWHFT